MFRFFLIDIFSLYVKDFINYIFEIKLILINQLYNENFCIYLTYDFEVSSTFL